MHSDSTRRRMWLTAGAMTLLSLATVAADSFHSLSSLRTAVHDLLSPGRRLLLSIAGHNHNQISAAQDFPGISTSHVTSPDGSAAETAGFDTGPDRHSESSTMQAAALATPQLQHLQQGLLESELQRRRLMIENARLRNQLRQQTMIQQVDTLLSPDGIEAGNGISRFGITSARVISSRGLTAPLQDLLVDAGQSAGITRSEMIVEGSGLLLDRGQEHQVASGDRVLAGAVVVGRISQTGRWVSLVQPLTDPDFSARVQLMRSSSQGPYFGAEGILCGTQPDDGQPATECVINGIPYTEAVSVGDEVVSSEISGIHGPRLYFGRVSRAEFLDGGQWRIRVRPAAVDMPMEHVGIIRLELHRDSAQSSPTPGPAARHPLVTGVP